jgi:ABC-2 type transport system ATP-binding protein/lipopolysaccharide transport system ATP-binding protein
LFPIYSAASRSFKNAMISATTGGRVGRDRSKHVCVQALDNVSLEIDEGDRVGLIGHNGAGKTTLLRVMAGIYEPQEGVVDIEGKVTPMFDVSLGIDPESSGHENIILRALYMGLSRAEIRKKVDGIAEFTELGDFLKLPVKTYSEGMQARLAFAIATCIEPEILLLDEGIGAGDAAFLAKANLRRARYIESTGILVLASHSEELIHKFCNKVVIMEHGRVLWGGDVDEGFDRYREATAQVKASPGPEPAQFAGAIPL